MVSIVIVEPAPDAVMVAPEAKLIDDKLVPLEDPPSSNSIPDETPSKLLPSP